jgi:hypothetical protein
MEPAARSVTDSKAKVWAARILAGVAVLFLLMDAAMKLVKPVPGPVSEAMVKLGYPVELGATLGAILLLCTVLYVIPRTAVLGAVLTTGYLGGAISTHVRIHDDPFTFVFPMIVAAFLWGSLYLRDPRVRAIFPLRG